MIFFQKNDESKNCNLNNKLQKTKKMVSKKFFNRHCLKSSVFEKGISISDFE